MSAEESMTAGARAHAIAEQAFTKGLERLKAKTASPSGLQAAASTGKMSEVRRARNGSQTSDEFKEESHDILGTTPESDGVSAFDHYPERSDGESVRLQIRRDGFTVTTNGKIWDPRVG